MSIYLFVFSLPLLRALIDKINKTSASRLLGVVIVVFLLFFCFSYMTGSDWRGYELKYNQFLLTDTYTTEWEPGFILYMSLYKFLGVDFWWFNILTKCILFYICVCNLKKISLYYFDISFLLFFVLYGLYLFIDFPMRNFISIGIFLCGIRFLYERKFLRYVVTIFLCTSFHASSIVLIFIYPLYKLSISKKKTILLFFIIFLFATFYSKSFLQLLLALLSYNTFFTEKANYYFSSNFEFNETMSYGFILHILFFISIVYNKTEFSRSQLGVFLYKMCLFYLCFYVLGFNFEILGRVKYFFCIPFSVGIVSLANFYQKQFRYLYLGFLCLFIYSSAYAILTESYKYIPYSNYLSYLFQDKPTYYERSNFNLIKSPYNKK